MTLNESIMKIRVDLQNCKIKKSGKNKFAGFAYYELADFLPKLNELMLENGVNDIFTINDEYAYLKLIKGDESNTYKIPFVMFEVPKNKGGQDSMQKIQYLGALNTYYKRYLYLNAFGITDGEVIDAMDNSSMAPDNKGDLLKELYKLIEGTPDPITTTGWVENVFQVTSIEDMSAEYLQSAINTIKAKKAKAKK